MVCVVCHKPVLSNWLCNTCKMPFERIWVVGERSGILQRLVGLYKFERAKSAHKELGDLLLDILPDLPKNTVVVPIPTVPSRIRERGYDHMFLIARHVAKSRKLSLERLVERKTNTKQRQSGAKKRELQAKQAFEVCKRLDSSVPYLLLDDVITTGATIKYASQALRDAGAEHVWAAVIARQTLG